MGSSPLETLGSGGDIYEENVIRYGATTQSTDFLQITGDCVVSAPCPSFKMAVVSFAAVHTM